MEGIDPADVPLPADVPPVPREETGLFMIQLRTSAQYLHTNQKAVTLADILFAARLTLSTLKRFNKSLEEIVQRAVLPLYPKLDQYLGDFSMAVKIAWDNPPNFDRIEPFDIRNTPWEDLLDNLDMMKARGHRDRLMVTVKIQILQRPQPLLPPPRGRGFRQQHVRRRNSPTTAQRRLDLSLRGDGDNQGSAGPFTVQETGRPVLGQSHQGQSHTPRPAKDKRAKKKVQFVSPEDRDKTLKKRPAGAATPVRQRAEIVEDENGEFVESSGEDAAERREARRKAAVARGKRPMTTNEEDEGGSQYEESEQADEDEDDSEYEEDEGVEEEKEAEEEEDEEGWGHEPEVDEEEVKEEEQINASSDGKPRRSTRETPNPIKPAGKVKGNTTKKPLRKSARVSRIQNISYSEETDAEEDTDVEEEDQPEEGGSSSHKPVGKSTKSKKAGKKKPAQGEEGDAKGNEARQDAE